MQNEQYILARKAYSDGNYAKAISQFQSLLFNDPSNVEIYLELSSALIANLQYDEALVVAKQAQLYLTEDFKISYLSQIGNIYLLQNRFDEAANLFNEILSINNSDLNAHIGLSHILLKQGYPCKAIKALEFVNSGINNDSRWIMNMSLALFNSRQVNLAIDLIINHLESSELRQDSLISNAMMFSSYSENRDDYLKKLEILTTSAVKDELPKSHREIKPENRSQFINIGFVSADFCWHPVGYFLSSFLGDFATHKTKVFLYSNNNHKDSITNRLIQNSSSYKVIKGLSTSQAIDLIKFDKIDLLIDLSGHTAGNRLDIFAQRAAPLQISYLGYPDIIDVPNIDFLLTDKNHISEADVINTCESIHYIDNSRFCFAPPIEAPTISPMPSIENGYITFGSFANPSKISNASLSTWLGVLKYLPNSRLKLVHRYWLDTVLQEKLLSTLTDMNIPRGRIEFYGHHQYEEYLHFYTQIDFILDTLPFAGGTTTCEALWMGVPVFTVEGLSPAARQSAAILRSLNEDHWIVTDSESIIDKINQIENDPSIINSFKSNIRGKFNNCSLGNGNIFAGNFHKSLIEMWKLKFSDPHLDQVS